MTEKEFDELIETKMGELTVKGILIQDANLDFSVAYDFDLTLRGNLGRLLKRCSDPNELESVLNEAYFHALSSYGLGREPILIDILRTFEKGDKLAKIRSAIGR